MTEKKITQAELDKKAQQLLEEKESEARMRMGSVSGVFYDDWCD